MLRCALGITPCALGTTPLVEMWIALCIKATARKEIGVHQLEAPGELGDKLWTEEWWFLEDVEGVAGLGAAVPLLHGERAVVL